MSKPGWAGAILAFAAGMLLSAMLLRGRDGSVNAAAVTQPSSRDDITALTAEVARLKGMVTDQSHVMADVSYHFSNLWFAGQAENWPLAQFYADETHSHLKWAVRVIPFRKDRAGRDVDLGGILTALEQTSLKDLDESIKAKDKSRFTTAYKAQLTNCMACHKAASKEFIVLHVPERPDVNMVEFRPVDGAAP
jgi:hypothetical protein